MKKRHLLPLLTLLLAAFSCAENGGGPSPEPLPDPEPGPEDFAGYTRVALHSEISKVQPMTGIVVWTDSDSANKSFVQLEFSYMLYSDVCKQKDVFDWTVVDRLLAGVAARGHQCVLRFRYTYPGKSCAVPAYIKAMSGYEAKKARADGAMTEFPDWRSEELQRFHMEFFRQFAQRYDADPRLAFLEVGFGLWAEYHIWDGPMELGRTFPSYDFQDRYLRAMDSWFSITPWCISIDARNPRYAPFEDRPELLELGFGNFDDSFMCEEYFEENYKNWLFFGQQRHKTAPMGGEFSYYSDYDQRHCLDRAGMYGRTFEELAAKVHMTFIIGNDQPRFQKDDRLKEASMALGYRFCVEDFLIKEGVGAAVLISNEGIAPIYKDAYVAVGGVRGGYSLRALMPGESRWIRVDSPAITAASPLTIECDHLVSGQVIQFRSDVE